MPLSLIFFGSRAKVGDNVMNCACATFRSKLEKFRRNFSSLNSINSKWRRQGEPVVVCQQGEFDCND